MGNAYVPNDGRRWLAATPTTLGIILKSPEFISASSLGDEVKQTGALGRIAGFNVYEDPTLSATTDFIVGHPDWCHFVEEWKVPIAINNLADGKHIGASARAGPQRVRLPRFPRPRPCTSRRTPALVAAAVEVQQRPRPSAAAAKRKRGDAPCFTCPMRTTTTPSAAF